jgi:hypothetical protein
VQEIFAALAGVSDIRFQARSHHVQGPIHVKKRLYGQANASGPRPSVASQE